MITQEQQKQGAELMRTLVEKAWESATFKDQLVKNPVETIESVTGNKLNQEVNFVVEDQTDSSVIYLNIPRNLDIENIELSDEQLENVSGGEAVLIGLGVVLTALMAGIMVGNELQEKK